MPLNDRAVECVLCGVPESDGPARPLPHRMTSRGVMCAECYVNWRMAERLRKIPAHLRATESMVTPSTPTGGYKHPEY